MISKALPYILALGLLRGTSLVAARFGVGQFHPATFMGLRLTVAGLCYASVYIFSRRRHLTADYRLWRHAAMFGVIGTAIPMTALITSMQYQSSGITSLMITTVPALTVLLAHFFLPDEALTRTTALGVALSLGGAVLLVLRGESGLPDASQASLAGYGLAGLATVCFSGSIIYARKYMRDLDTFDVASIRIFVAALTTMPLSLLFVGFDLDAVDEQGIFALGYTALAGTFAGLLLSFYNIKRFGATAASMSAYVVPMVAGAGGVLVLGETFTAVMLAGMGAIVLGITLINRRGARQGEQFRPAAASAARQ